MEPTMTVRLTTALREAAAAHGVHEAELGRPDEDWPSWYADHMAQALTTDGYELRKPSAVAYLINHLRIPNGIPKPDSLTYLEKVEATFKPYGGKWLVLDADVQVLEGAWPGSTVLMEFPDMDAAKTWYHSPEYQEILGLRTNNAISDLVLIDHVGPDFTSADWARQIRAAIGGVAAAG